MGKKTSDVQDAIEDALSDIDAMEYSGTTVSPADTKEFLEGIVEGCRVRIGALDGGDEEDEEDEDDDDE